MQLRNRKKLMRSTVPKQCRPIDRAFAHHTIVRSSKTLKWMATYLFAAACSLNITAHAQAQVSLHVTTAAGGPTDRLARLLAPSLGQSLGQAVSVVPAAMPGQSVAIVKELSGAPSDGSLLLIGDMTLVLQLRAAGLDIDKELSIASVIGEYPVGLIARRGGGAQNLDQLRSMLAAGSLIAHSGDNTVSKRCVELITPTVSSGAMVTGYRGMGPMLADLQAGRIAAGCAVLAPSVARTYQVLALNRPSSRPELQGVPVSAALPSNLGLVAIFLPKGAADATLDRVAAALKKALADPQVRSQLAAEYFLE